jgi:hypothetical protein
LSKDIFIVTEGSYSDYHIMAAFLNKKRAETFATRFGAEVETWPAGDHYIDMLRDKNVYFLRISKDGTVSDLEKNDNDFAFRQIIEHNDKGYDSAGNLYMYVLAKTEQHAVKIAGDKRRKLIALEQWGKYPIT